MGRPPEFQVIIRIPEGGLRSLHLGLGAEVGRMLKVVPKAGASYRRPRYGTLACDCARDLALRKANLRGGCKAALLRAAACAFWSSSNTMSMAKSRAKRGAQLPFLRMTGGSLWVRGYG